MEVPVSLTLLSLMFLSTVAVLSIFVAVPWTGRYLFRSELWQVRDRIVDDVLVGHLPADHAAVKRLVTRAEGAVRFADGFGLASVFALHLAARRTGHRFSPDPLPLQGLGAAQQERLKAYNREIADCAVRYTTTRSGTGWALMLVASPAIIVMLLARRVRSQTGTLAAVRRHVGRDFQMGADAVGVRSHA